MSKTDKLTEAQVRETLADWNALLEQALEIAKIYLQEVAGYEQVDPDVIQETDITDGYNADGEKQVFFAYNPSCRCHGGWNYESFLLPLSVLWDPAWLETEKAKKQAAAEETARREAEEKAEQERYWEEHDQKEYERLKAKYEGSETA